MGRGADTFAYDPLDRLTGSTVAGTLLDPSGLYYLRARRYDPASGRVLSRDPLASEPETYQALNAFGYAAGNPLRNMDPTGLMWARDDLTESANSDPEVGAGRPRSPTSGQGSAVSGRPEGGSTGT